MAMKHLYKIYPKRTLRGIRPKEIMEPTILENLNRQEFLKCFNAGELYAIVNDKEIHIKECNYDKAEALFVEKETLVKPEVAIEQPNVETILTPTQVNEIEEKAAEMVNVVAPVMEDNTNKNMRSYSDEIVDKTLEHAAAVVVETPDIISVTIVDNGSVDNVTATSMMSTEENIVVTGNSDETNNITNDQKIDEQQITPEVVIPEKSDETEEIATDPEPENDEKLDDSAVVPEKVIDEEVDKKEQQPQQYSKNHNKQQYQTNYRNQKNGKQNKGKFVINNG